MVFPFPSIGYKGEETYIAIGVRSRKDGVVRFKDHYFNGLDVERYEYVGIQEIVKDLYEPGTEILDIYQSPYYYWTKRRSAKTAKYASCYYADLDVKNKYPDIKDKYVMYAIINHCRKFCLPKPLVMNSGGKGYQVFWPFRSFFPIDNKKMKTFFSDTLKTIQYMLSDLCADNVSDCARLLRKVGTVNSKTGNKSYFLNILDFDYCHPRDFSNNTGFYQLQKELKWPKRPKVSVVKRIENNRSKVDTYNKGDELIAHEMGFTVKNEAGKNLIWLLREVKRLRYPDTPPGKVPHGLRSKFFWVICQLFAESNLQFDKSMFSKCWNLVSRLDILDDKHSMSPTEEWRRSKKLFSDMETRFKDGSYTKNRLGYNPKRANIARFLDLEYSRKRYKSEIATAYMKRWREQTLNTLKRQIGSSISSLNRRIYNKQAALQVIESAPEPTCLLERLLRSCTIDSLEDDKKFSWDIRKDIVRDYIVILNSKHRREYYLHAGKDDVIAGSVATKHRFSSQELLAIWGNADTEQDVEPFKPWEKPGGDKEKSFVSKKTVGENNDHHIRITVGHGKPKNYPLPYLSPTSITLWDDGDYVTCLDPTPYTVSKTSVPLFTRDVRRHPSLAWGDTIEHNGQSYTLTLALNMGGTAYKGNRFPPVALHYTRGQAPDLDVNLCSQSYSATHSNVIGYLSTNLPPISSEERSQIVASSSPYYHSKEPIQETSYMIDEQSYQFELSRMPTFVHILSRSLSGSLLSSASSQLLDLVCSDWESDKWRLPTTSDATELSILMDAITDIRVNRLLYSWGLTRDSHGNLPPAPSGSAHLDFYYGRLDSERTYRRLGKPYRPLINYDDYTGNPRAHSDHAALSTGLPTQQVAELRCLPKLTHILESKVPPSQVNTLSSQLRKLLLEDWKDNWGNAQDPTLARMLTDIRINRLLNMWGLRRSKTGQLPRPPAIADHLDFYKKQLHLEGEAYEWGEHIEHLVDYSDIYGGNPDTFQAPTVKEVDFDDGYFYTNDSEQREVELSKMPTYTNILSKKFTGQQLANISRYLHDYLENDWDSDDWEVPDIVSIGADGSFALTEVLFDIRINRLLCEWRLRRKEDGRLPQPPAGGNHITFYQERLDEEESRRRECDPYKPWVDYSDIYGGEADTYDYTKDEMRRDLLREEGYTPDNAQLSELKMLVMVKGRDLAPNADVIQNLLLWKTGEHVIEYAESLGADLTIRQLGEVKGSYGDDLYLTVFNLGSNIPERMTLQQLRDITDRSMISDAARYYTNEDGKVDAQRQQALITGLK